LWSETIDATTAVMRRSWWLLGGSLVSALIECMPHRGDRRVQLVETLLRDGDSVEIVGYKSRVVDPRFASRLAREEPYRATLRGGQALPLLISPLRSPTAKPEST
jgi:hypothetical protein